MFIESGLNNGGGGGGGGSPFESFLPKIGGGGGGGGGPFENLFFLGSLFISRIFLFKSVKCVIEQTHIPCFSHPMISNIAYISYEQLLFPKRSADSRSVVNIAKTNRRWQVTS